MNDHKVHFRKACSLRDEGKLISAVAEFRSALALGAPGEAGITRSVIELYHALDYRTLGKDLEDGVPGRDFDFNLHRMEISRFIRLKVVADSVRAELTENSKVLDVGGGDGIFSFFISEFRYVLVEPEVNQQPGLDLPYSDGEFEGTVSIGMLEHVESEESREAVLDEMVRVCSKRLFVSVPVDENDPWARDRVQVAWDTFRPGWAKEHLDIEPVRDEHIRKYLNSRKLEFRTSSYGDAALFVVSWFMRWFGELAGKMDVVKRVEELVNRNYSDSFVRGVVPPTNLYVIYLD